MSTLLNRTLSPIVATLSICGALFAQTLPQMVEDLNPGPDSSNVKWITQVGNRLFFSADNGQNGIELWIRDGLGSRMVKDIVPGPNSSQPEHLVALNGFLLFAAARGDTGVELWASDGTEQGTFMVRDILPGALGSHPTHLFQSGGVVYFSANDGLTGHELWRTDGTQGGTVSVKDIHPGSPISDHSQPRHFASLPDGRLVFRAQGDTEGIEPWISDGTPGGTTLLKDIRPGVLGSEPAEMASFGGRVYFRANDGTNGHELWSTDGTANGTVLVKDIRAGSSGSRPSSFAILGNSLLFRADSPFSGAELWMTDGTGQGTVLLKEIRQGSSGSAPDFLTPVATGHVYFTANDGNTGPELWRTNGTADGTELIQDTLMGVNGIGPTNAPEAVGHRFAVLDGGVYFAANDGQHGRELWSIAAPNAAMVESFGMGCVGSSGIPVLAPAPGSKPWIDDTFAVQLSSLPTTPSTQVFGLVGFSKTAWGPAILPQDLGFIGAPGCTQLVSIEVAFPLPHAGGQASLVLSIPNDPSLRGVQFFTQGLVIDVAGSVLYSVSNALGGSIGVK